MSIIEQYNNELYHYGVLGMKWGVRKNPVKAYVKANKKKSRLERQVRFTSGMVDEATKQTKESRLKEQQLLEDARVSKANVELTARDLELKTKKYMNSTVDPFGAKASAVGKATKSYNEAVETHNKRAEAANRAILDRAASEDSLAYWTERAERATARSKYWTSAMDTAFKDVSPEDIAAGKAILERKNRK